MTKLNLQLPIATLTSPYYQSCLNCPIALYCYVHPYLLQALFTIEGTVCFIKYRRFVPNKLYTLQKIPQEREVSMEPSVADTEVELFLCL